MAARPEKVNNTLVSVAQREHLRAWASSRQSAPLLLSGNSEDLLAATSQELAEAMLCEKNSQGTTLIPACGKCRACRLVASGNHPDILRLRTDRATWAIKDMRQVFKATAVTALGHRRVVIIEMVEKVSVPAANALLKSLEEPRPATSFILTTRWPTRLLPTVLSRCDHIHLRAPLAPQAPGRDIDPTKLTAEDLDGETLEALAHRLEQHLRTLGPTPQLRRAYARLRDYYFITSRHGNSKLAGDVLLLSLPMDNGMS